MNYLFINFIFVDRNIYILFLFVYVYMCITVVL